MLEVGGAFEDVGGFDEEGGSGLCVGGFELLEGGGASDEGSGAEEEEGGGASEEEGGGASSELEEGSGLFVVDDSTTGSDEGSVEPPLEVSADVVPALSEFEWVGEEDEGRGSESDPDAD